VIGANSRPMLVYVKYCPSRAAQSDFDCTTLKDWLALAHIQRIKRVWIGRDSEQRSLDAVEINGSTCFDSLVTFQRRIMHTTAEADERFYLDTREYRVSSAQRRTAGNLGVVRHTPQS